MMEKRLQKLALPRLHFHIRPTDRAFMDLAYTNATMEEILVYNVHFEPWVNFRDVAKQCGDDWEK